MPDIVLQTDCLTKRYGSLTAVNELSLTIYRGEVFGFLGPNGAGKTTSIRMMVGLLKPDSGRVLIYGKPLDGRDPAARARVGICPQEIVIWGTLTCQEQLEFIGEMYGLPRAKARTRAAALLDDLGLSPKKNALARTLSGGMQRRLNLAAALVHDPEIVVLDEPEAGLDPQSRVLVRDYIRAMACEKTVILTTQNMDEAERLASRVAIIDHGCLLELDSPAALKQRSGAGDVLEIRLRGAPGPESGLRAALAKLAGVQTVQLRDDNLLLRAGRAVSLLPQVLQLLDASGLAAEDIRLRESTLEDVFIQLTGRSLRE